MEVVGLVQKTMVYFQDFELGNLISLQENGDQNPQMTNLPLLPLALENGVPHKGLIMATESNYEESDGGEAGILVETERTLIFNGNVHHNHQDDLKSLNGNSILGIKECTVFEGDFTQNSEADEPKKRLSNSLVKECEEKKRFRPNLSLDAPPLWGLTSICGRRKEMEDTVVALPRFLSIPSSMLGDISIFSSTTQDLTAHVFGVFDGHGGSQVSNYCRDRMHLVLAEEIGIAKEISGDGNWEQQWLNIFLNCFHKLDDEVGGFSILDSKTSLPSIAPESVGSTAVVAVVCSTHIIVANCGDSRAVLCRGRVSMPLSVDHKPNSEGEFTRIEAAGGRVINWDGYRVSGFLAVSRSIGDRYLRPYVVADPEVMFVPRVKDDECLILASDGLWDVMTNEEACDLARRRIVLWHKKNIGSTTTSKETGNDIDAAAQDAADYLLKFALQRGSGDNISVMVIDLKAQRKYKKKV